MATKKRILFLCTGNSARSQLAEAILRSKAGELFDIVSAGTSPEGVDKRTIATLDKYGISTEGLCSKDITTITNQSFDYVITLCELANNECRQFERARLQYFWDLADPKSSTDEYAFDSMFLQINQRIKLFLEIELGMQEEAETAIDVQQFYKCLTDEIRIKTLMLSHYFGEICVCELMEALHEADQPKVSRNLAVLRKAGILVDRKHGQWVFYHINPKLPLWAKSVLRQTTESNTALIKAETERLKLMQNRPSKVGFCR